MNRLIERPQSGVWRPDVVRAVLSGHSILGIAFAGLIYLICLTGTFSVFMRDFQRWEQPAAPTLPRVSDEAVGRAIANMGAKVGTNTSFYVSLPTEDFPRLMLLSANGSHSQTWFADARGDLVARQKSIWTDFLTDLHTRLHLPQNIGRFIVGLTGVALLSSLISGVLAHPRIFRDAFHLRLGGSRRLEQADLHNRLGIWPLPFHIIVSLTGALLGLSTVIVGVLALLLFRGDSQRIYSLLAPPPATADARSAPMPDVGALLALARQRAPDAELRQIEVSHWGRRDMRMELSAARPRLIAQQDSLVYDASGRVVLEKHPGGLTVGEQILGSLGPLHFGWFGGFAIRLAYGLLGIALCVVTSSGIRVWLARRRDKGRAAPGLERLWIAVSWGQPVAIAAMAPVALLMPDRMPASTLSICWAWATLALLALPATLARVSAAQLRRYGRSVTASLLAATAILHAALMVGRAGDPHAIVVDGFAIVTAAVLAFGGRHARGTASD